MLTQKGRTSFLQLTQGVIECIVDLGFEKKNEKTIRLWNEEFRVSELFARPNSHVTDKEILPPLYENGNHLILSRKSQYPIMRIGD